ncbi:MAG TPA: endonuclease/exonuclease/phosphatase family protein [Pyrinomonadaceae bacterium]|nr:endonuclease/exonuclease/phosphatase family protein [Pyrinomonadaceae bacterium]
MTAGISAQANSPLILEHNLENFFAELMKYNSVTELEKSAVYRKIKPEVERILNAVVQGDFAAREMSEPPASADGLFDKIHALAWNIERGNRFGGIVEALKNHTELKDKDLLLLTELDYGMARSGNRFVARDLARELELNYAFAPCYIALQKGSGIEANVAGENTKSLHGLAMFSKYPMRNTHAVALPNGKDKMFGKEKRLGYLRALVADIEHPAGIFRAVTVHLDAHSSRKHRHFQMRIVLDHLENLPSLPTIIGGDWNTTTYNAQSANRAILGYFRRVLMGVKNVVRNHYPHPDRYFEKGLFRELEKRGFDYKNLNETGAGTLHYDMENAAYNTNLGDWVPRWCFPFIFWAAKKVGGRVSARLDWFAGKAIEVKGKPKTVGDLVDAENLPLSDHDAITLDFAPQKD